MHIGAFNKEKALEGTFSVIVKTSRRFVASSKRRQRLHLNWFCLARLGDSCSGWV